MTKPGLFLGTGFGSFSSWEGDMGSPRVPFSKSLLPAWSWSRHVLPPSCPLARKLQTLLVPNDHHLPLLGFAVPLFLCQLVVGLCCWLLFAGVSALDQVRAWSGQCLGTSRVGWVCPALASSRSVLCNSTSKPVLLCCESQGRWQERTVTASTAIPGEEGDACSPPSKLLRRRSEFGLGLMSGAALPSCVHRDGAAARVCSSKGAFWRRVVAVSVS